MRDVDTDERSAKFDESKVNGQVIRDLRYADDTVFLSRSEDGLENLTKSVKDPNESKNLLLNVKKTKILDILGSIPSKISVDGEAIENVTSLNIFAR